MRRRTARIMDRVRETLRPGTTGHDFDAPLRAMVAAGYADPVHMGHGIGTSVHERPRLVPGWEAVIAPGMVLMVEPGCHHPDMGGVRLERMVPITEGGHEGPSPFDVPPEMPPRPTAPARAPRAPPARALRGAVGAGGAAARASVRMSSFSPVSGCWTMSRSRPSGQQPGLQDLPALVHPRVGPRAWA